MVFAYSRIVEKMDMGEGTRVEMDFVDALGGSEGVLVGDSARGFVCVLGETRSTDTYPPRPFRVNGGALHQYVWLGENRTKYLAEIAPGDRVLITDGERERTAAIGRAKLERRPFTRIVLENGVTATLQQADSVFVAGRDGAMHFVDLQIGDEIACMMAEDVARHKGEVVQEEILEK